MKKETHARSTAVVIRVHPENRDLLKLNAGLHGMSVSDYARQTCLNLRLRRTPEEKRRLRELASVQGWGDRCLWIPFSEFQQE
ncbi:plasmid mobilization protein [Mailhella sp.]